VAVLGAVVAAGGAIGATSPEPSGATASAKALAVRIVFPTGRVVGSAAAGGDKGGTAASGSYAYPADGSAIVTGATKAVTTAAAGKIATSSSTSSAANISLFDGEITADSAAAHASASGSARQAGGAFGGTSVSNLQALGRPHAFGRAGLGNWGYLVIATHTTKRTVGFDTHAYEGVSIALDVHLVTGHGGLPAGTEIEVGYAETSSETAAPAIADFGPVAGDQPRLLPAATGPLVGVPQEVEPELTAAPYVYPVYGSTSSSDSYGNAKQGNAYQHGIDIFGGLGQPIVAAAAGSLYSVGWNHASGNRLWLRDRQGNQFLYAHLSAFSTLTANGAHVRAGQVIGFMGDTGNTGGLATHLHFEVHPVSMLFLGFDGAVDPTPYLASWRHIASLAFPVATGWAPKVPGTIRAPEPGVVPLGATDISTANGLDPASLRRSLKPGPVPHSAGG
jgi:murein DD-endopeptidase MepM/ murein hydrolase activator NlpD